MRNRLAAMVLVFEAITAGLAIAVTQALHESSNAIRMLTVAAMLGLIGAAVMRRPFGVVIAWSAQLVMLATAVVLPMFAFIAVPYLALWWYCLRIGARIDRERRHAQKLPNADDAADSVESAQ